MLKTKLKFIQRVTFIFCFLFYKNVHSQHENYIERKTLGNIRVIQSFIYKESALVIVEAHLDGGRSGPMLLWVPQLNGTAGYQLDLRDQEGPLLANWENKTRGNFYRTSKEERALITAWFNLYDQHKQFSSFFNIHKVEPLALFQSGTGAQLIELISPIEGHDLILVKSSKENQINLHSTKENSDSVSFLTQEALVEGEDQELRQGLHQVKKQIQGQSFKIFSQPEVNEKNPHILFFQTESPGGQTEILALFMTFVNQKWEGKAIKYYAPLHLNQFNLVSPGRSSVSLGEFKFYYDPSSNQYQMNQMGLKQFDPSLFLRVSEMNWQEIGDKEITPVSIAVQEEGFYLNRQFYKPIDQAELAFQHLKYLEGNSGLSGVTRLWEDVKDKHNSKLNKPSLSQKIDHLFQTQMTCEEELGF